MMNTCPMCKGKGTVPQSSFKDAEKMIERWCATCKGTGKLDDGRQVKISKVDGKLVIEIDEKSAALIGAVLDARKLPDDDGRSEVLLMDELNLTPEEFVKVEHMTTGLIDVLRKAGR